MNHLSDEAFEAALRDPAVEAAHLADCPACRRRLEELQAVRARLRSAFAGIQAPSGLAARIQAAATGAPVGQASLPAIGHRHRGLCHGHGIAGKFRRHAWPLAVATILVAAVPILYFLAGPSSAGAAQEELIGIHRENLAGGHGFYRGNDPRDLAQYFKEKLGFSPAMPRGCGGMAVRGCCVHHYRGKITGSWVVDTPQGVVSVIVVTDPPETLGLSERSVQGGGTIWEGTREMCHMAATRMGGCTYTAVGEVSQSTLTTLLSLLMQ